MRESLKKRLIGAAVLVSLVVTILPLLLREPPRQGKTPEPPPMPKPPSGVFESRLLDDEVPAPVPKPAKRPPPVAPPQAELPARKARVGLTGWVVQVASLSKAKGAESLINALKKAGLHAAFSEQIQRDGKTLHRVRIGPLLDRKDADALLAKTRKVKLRGVRAKSIVVVRYP